MYIMDKLIEHLEFTSAVSRIRYVAFVAAEESGRSGLKAEVDFGLYDPNVSDSQSNHITSLNDTLLTFATMDHASFLGLGNLDMVGMRQLGALDEVDEVPDGMLIEGVGGDGGDNDGNNDSGGDNGDDGGGAVVGGDGGDDLVDSKVLSYRVLPLGV